MLIRHIRIENYRSIKRVDIPVNDMLALVGPNNAGKTNILSALNLVLGERWPSRQSLDASDWFERRTSDTLKIEIFFVTTSGI
jgi:predicted ATP-dependent endonuclease of OLD family